MAYKYSINVRGDKELLQQISNGLQGLGYRPDSGTGIVHASVLSINQSKTVKGENGVFEFWEEPAKRDFDIIVTQSWQVDYVLALAAIRVEEGFHVGEYFKYNSSPIKSDEANFYYKVATLNEGEDGVDYIPIKGEMGGDNHFHVKSYMGLKSVKLTREELADLFNDLLNNKQTKPVMPKTKRKTDFSKDREEKMFIATSKVPELLKAAYVLAKSKGWVDHPEGGTKWNEKYDPLVHSSANVLLFATKGIAFHNHDCGFGPENTYVLEDEWADFMKEIETLPVINEKEISISEGRAVVKIKGTYISAGTTKGTKHEIRIEDVKRLINYLERAGDFDFGPWNAHIDKVRIGCTEESIQVTLSDLDFIVSEYDSINKK